MSRKSRWVWRVLLLTALPITYWALTVPGASTLLGGLGVVGLVPVGLVAILLGLLDAALVARTLLLAAFFVSFGPAAGGGVTHPPYVQFQLWGFALLPIVVDAVWPRWLSAAITLSAGFALWETLFGQNVFIDCIHTGSMFTSVWVALDVAALLVGWGTPAVQRLIGVHGDAEHQATEPRKR